MANWMNTRLFVVVDGDTANPITPIDSFSPSFNMTTEVVHSLEATHVGYVSGPATFSFNMTVSATSDSAARLMKLAMEGTEFDIALMETDDSSGEWSFKEITLSSCLITSANPTNASPNTAPQASFSGVCRGANVDSAEGASKLPQFAG